MATELAPELIDVPIDVVLSDGSEWTLYYRIYAAHPVTQHYAFAFQHLKNDVREGNWFPRKVWRGGAYYTGIVNCAQVVSCSPSIED